MRTLSTIFKVSARAVLLAAGVCALAPLCGFDSYKYPFEEVERNPDLQKEIKKDLQTGRFYADHYDITRECMAKAGVGAAIAEALSQGASDIDFNNWNSKRQYEAKNHVDRPMGVSHQQAMKDALRYHRERFAEAWNSFAHGDTGRILKILPRALHVQQDFFSHSNFVDLNADDQSVLLACWTTYAQVDPVKGRSATEVALARDDRCIAGTQAWEERIRITGFDRNAADPYHPPGDPYPHRLFAKDGPHHNEESQRPLPDGRSKYQAAREAAVKACVLLVHEFGRYCQADRDCRPHTRKMFPAIEQRAK